MLGDYVFTGQETLCAFTKTTNTPLVFDLPHMVIRFGPLTGRNTIDTYDIKDWELGRDYADAHGYYHCLFVVFMDDSTHRWLLRDSDLVILHRSDSQLGPLYVGL